MDVEEGHRSDSGAAETVMPRSMFPEISTEETERSMNGKGFNKNYGQQVVLLRDLYARRKSTWQVAYVRRPLVSAHHIIQAGNDLFVGKDEAYIMNRRKKEQSLLRKEENVYVLDLFAKVPPRQASTSPWCLTQSITLQMEESKGGESRSTATAQLFDGRRSERGRQVQAN